MLSRISLALTYIEEILKDILVYRKVTLENVTGYIRSCGAFGILIHMFACAWLYVGAIDDEWMTDENLLYDKKSTLYVNALYFVTTTMTSVGYGDINAGGFVISMWAILLTQLFGILGFAIVKESIFNVKVVPTLDSIVKQSKQNMEEILFRIDQVKDEEIPPKMYDETIDYIGAIVRFSIKDSFADCIHWKMLKP